jgi:hypothetical protein
MIRWQVVLTMIDGLSLDSLTHLLDFCETVEVIAVKNYFSWLKYFNSKKEKCTHFILSERRREYHNHHRHHQQQ